MKLSGSDACGFDKAHLLMLPNVIHLQWIAQSVAMALQMLPLLGEDEAVDGGHAHGYMTLIRLGSPDVLSTPHSETFDECRMPLSREGLFEAA
jgi:hypothetical protein